MKLLVDIGNSRIKWAAAADDEIGPLQGFARPREHPADAFDDAWGELRPSAVVACSVAGRGTADALRDWVAARWDLPLVEVRSRARLGSLVNAYPEPATLGADRWANLIAARAVHGPVDAVIVDAGTAVTVDALGGDGRHAGGAILPGLAAARAGLRAAAPMLPQAGDSVGLPAADTEGALGAGSLVGLAGGIDRVAETVARGLAEPVLLITGGDAERLLPLLRGPWRHDPLLTLRGLQAAGEAPCAG